MLSYVNPEIAQVFNGGESNGKCSENSNTLLKKSSKQTESSCVFPERNDSGILNRSILEISANEILSGATAFRNVEHFASMLKEYIENVIFLSIYIFK